MNDKRNILSVINVSSKIAQTQDKSKYCNIKKICERSKKLN